MPGMGSGESGEAGDAAPEAGEPWEALPSPPLLISSPSQTWTGACTIYLRRNQNHQATSSRRVQSLALDTTVQGALGVPTEESRGLKKPGGCSIDGY